MARILPPPAAYVPYHDIGGRPHIVVDGKDQGSSLLTLSHWPWNRTPEHLRRDTSTHIAYAYLEDSAAHVEADIVSNSHYDEDGLLSMFALVNPELAMQYKDLCIATSYASDFWKCTDEDAAKLSFVLAAWSDEELSPIPKEVFDAPLRQRIIGQYTHMLEALPSILEDPFRDEAMWHDEYAFWEQSCNQIVSGEIRIEEKPELDLAIVHVPASFPLVEIRRYLGCWQLPVHPFAVTEKTNCSRLVWVHGDKPSFQYRYESWVQIASYRPQPRIDLQPLAHSLNEIDAGDWVFDGVHEVAAGLYSRTDSSLGPDRFIELLSETLRAEPPAWDPYGEPPETQYEGAAAAEESD